MPTTIVTIPWLYAPAVERQDRARVVVETPHLDCRSLPVALALMHASAGPGPRAIIVPSKRLAEAVEHSRRLAPDLKVETYTPSVKRVAATRSYFTSNMETLTALGVHPREVYVVDAHLLDEEPTADKVVAIGAKPLRGTWFAAWIEEAKEHGIRLSEEEVVAAFPDQEARLVAPASKFESYRRDPVGFVADVLGIKKTATTYGLTRMQEAALMSIVDNKKTLALTAPDTGKTLTAAIALLWFGSVFPGSHIITTGPTFSHLKMKLWPEVHSRHGGAIVALGGDLDMTSLRWGPDWVAYGLSTNRPSAFGGTHKEHMLVEFDDAHGVSPPIWNVTDDNLMSGDGARWFATANPMCDESHPCYRAAQPGSGWNVVEFSALEHPNVIERRQVIPGAVSHVKVDRYRKFGEESYEWHTGVLGKFPKGQSKNLMSRATFAANADKRLSLTPPEAHVGFDVADHGEDFNVASLYVNRRLVAKVKWRGVDINLMITCGRLVDLVEREWPSDTSLWDGWPTELKKDGTPVWPRVIAWHDVHLDGTGVGSGVGARLHELEKPVDIVNFGEGSQGDWDFSSGVALANRRAEMFFNVAQLAREGLVIIPEIVSGESTEELVEDLTAPKWSKTIRSDGARYVEPKEDIAKRLGRSPDEGDSTVLAFCRTGGRGCVFS